MQFLKKDAYNAEQVVIKAFAGEILCRGEKARKSSIGAYCLPSINLIKG